MFSIESLLSQEFTGFAVGDYLDLLIVSRPNELIDEVELFGDLLFGELSAISIFEQRCPRGV